MNFCRRCSNRAIYVFRVNNEIFCSSHCATQLLAEVHEVVELRRYADAGDFSSLHNDIQNYLTGG